MDILTGEKTREYKGDTPFWEKRLDKAWGLLNRDRPVAINFLCGRKSYKFRVNEISFYDDIKKNIDGTIYDSYWEIYLGERIFNSDNQKLEVF